MSDAEGADAEADSAGEENEGPLPEQIRVFRVTAVSGPCLKSPWLPDVQTVEGVEYIRLTKWSPQLTKLCTGRTKQLHNKKEQHTMNVQWFQDTTQLRREACDAAVKRLILENVPANTEPPAKIRRAIQQDEYMVGRSILVNMPAISDGWPERAIRFLWGVKGSDLFMELTAENFSYIRQAIMASPKVEPKEIPAGKSPKRKKRRRMHSQSPKKNERNGGHELEDAAAERVE